VQGWKELPNSSVTDQSASGMFSRNGFVVFVSVTPNGDGSLQVRLQNQGNVKPGKLPVPPNAKPVYVGDSTAMYETEAAVPATVDACRNLFVAQGWVPYGDAGDSAMFQTERKPRHRDCLVRTSARREDHDPVFESVNFG
jgi:hypothetical protein